MTLSHSLASPKESCAAPKRMSADGSFTEERKGG